MQQLHRWILRLNNTWHCWPTRGRSTYCGRINVEHLRVTPAVAITDAPALDGKICTACARKSGYVSPAATCADASTGAWIGVISRHLIHVNVRVAADSVGELARRIAEVGSPGDAEARELFERIRPVLLRPVWVKKKYLSGKERSTASVPHLKESLALLPPEPGALRKVAAAITAWQQVTRRDPMVEKYNLARVIGAMLSVPDPTLYVTHLHGRGLPTLAAMFHPNTLERARRETALRGMFAGGSQYWQNTMSQLHIIED